MSSSSRSNLPQHEPLRWNVEVAAREFGMTEMTLRKSLAQNSACAGEDGCYSTREIREAVYGDLHSERILTQRQLTRRYELNNRIVEGSVVDRAELMRLLASVADAMTSRIECSGLSREEKIDLRRDLSSIRPGIDGIAASQSKLPRDVDGDDDGDGEDDVADGRKVRKTRFRTRPGFKA